MKNLLSRSFIFLVLFISENLIANCQNPLEYSFSFNYCMDISDTYRGGSLIQGEFAGLKSWYGACISYGHFQSQSTYAFEITVDEILKSIKIPIDEMAIMQMGTLSFLLRPIQKKWISTDILFGFAFGLARSSILENVYYNYNFSEERFTYLYREYKLYKKTHTGYQFGFNITFYITQKFGIQLNSRIQDLSKGGTFFFVGTGLCFKL